MFASSQPHHHGGAQVSMLGDIGQSCPLNQGQSPGDYLTATREQRQSSNAAGPIFDNYLGSYYSTMPYNISTRATPPSQGSISTASQSPDRGYVAAVPPAQAQFSDIGKFNSQHRQQNTFTAPNKSQTQALSPNNSPTNPNPQAGGQFNPSTSHATPMAANPVSFPTNILASSQQYDQSINWNHANYLSQGSSRCAGSPVISPAVQYPHSVFGAAQLYSNGPFSQGQMYSSSPAASNVLPNPTPAMGGSSAYRTSLGFDNGNFALQQAMNHTGAHQTQYQQVSNGYQQQLSAYHSNPPVNGYHQQTAPNYQQQPVDASLMGGHQNPRVTSQFSPQPHQQQELAQVFCPSNEQWASVATALQDNAKIREKNKRLRKERERKAALKKTAKKSSKLPKQDALSEDAKTAQHPASMDDSTLNADAVTPAPSISRPMICNSVNDHQEGCTVTKVLGSAEDPIVIDSEEVEQTRVTGFDAELKKYFGGDLEPEEYALAYVGFIEKLGPFNPDNGEIET